MNARARVLLFFLCLFGYAAIAAFGHAQGSSHVLALFALPARNLVLLPAVIFLLRTPRESAAAGHNARLPNLRWATLFLFIAFAVSSCALSWWTSRGILISDEGSYRFQARIFGRGLLWASAPPAVAAPFIQFAHNVLTDSRWYSKYPPLWPLVLSAGQRLGLDWLVNPVLTLLTLALAWRFAVRHFDRRTADLAMFLSMLSPFVLANSVGAMSHASCAFLAAIATFGMLEGLREQRMLPCVVSLFALALACFVRPFTGLALSIPVGFGMLFWGAALRWRLLAIGAALGALTLLAFLGYNTLYTGSPFVSPYALSTGKAGLHEINLRPPVLWHNLTVISRWALENSLTFTFPFMLLTACLMVFLIEPTRRIYLLLPASLFALMAAYVVQSDTSASINGDRYYFEGFVPASIAAAYTCRLLTARWAFSVRSWQYVLGGLAAVQILTSVLSLREYQRRAAPFLAVRHAIEASGFHQGLVFMNTSPTSAFTAIHFNLNDPEWRHAELIYLADVPPQQRPALTREFGRSRWIVATYDEARHQGCVSSPQSLALQ